MIRMTFPLDIVRALPKAELHVHLEGTVDPETLLELCACHGTTPPAPDAEGIDRWYRFEDFDEFLERYLFVAAQLRTPDDFALISERYLRHAHDQGVVHVEFHVSATTHLLTAGWRWRDLSEGIVAGCRAVEAAIGISWALIPDASPHLDLEATRGALAEIFSDPGDCVVALGFGGPTEPWWDRDWSPIFDDAREAGLHVVSHAGERGSAREVRHAIEVFGAERIQHGIGSVADPVVAELVASSGIACDVCPGSNLALKGVASPEDHPLPRMLDAGITVTLGSDDPPMFQTKLLDEYERAWEWCDLDLDGVKALARNSLEHSFAPEERVAGWVEGL